MSFLRVRVCGVQDHGEIPGTVGELTRFESVDVASEVGDKHFRDFSRGGEPNHSGTHVQSASPGKQFTITLF